MYFCFGKSVIKSNKHNVMHSFGVHLSNTPEQTPATLFPLAPSQTSQSLQGSAGIVHWNRDWDGVILRRALHGHWFVDLLVDIPPRTLHQVKDDAFKAMQGMLSLFQHRPA